MRCLPAPMIAAAVLFLVAAPAGLGRSGADAPGSIEVRQVWSRSVAQGRVGVLYATIVDRGEPDRLLGAETPVAEKVEMHESLTENGIMKMRPVEALSLAPGQPIVLKPGGCHMMLVGLRRALREGDTFPITFRFAEAGPVSATVHVAKAGAASAPLGPDHDGVGQEPRR